MTELLTAAQMRAIEAAAIASGEVTGLELMERAGRGVVEAILEEWPELSAGALPQTPGYLGTTEAGGRRAVVLCGPGNNGGDGFVVARLLRGLGWGVEVFLYGDAGKLPPDARVNYERWVAMGEVRRLTYAAFRSLQFHPNIYVDAIFGTGLSRAPAGDLGELLTYMAGGGGDYAYFHQRIVAIDGPSSLCLDSGVELVEPLPEAIAAWVGQRKRERGEYLLRARLTVTFDSPKIGHFLEQGPEACGKLVVKDIGLRHWREALPTSDGTKSGQMMRLPKTNLLTRVALVDDNRSFTKFRLFGKEHGHKYTHGHALVLSGPPGHGGAGRLAARGALRMGAGVVTVGCEPAAVAEHAARLDAVMIRVVGDAGGLAAVLEDRRINALCLGPGLGLDAGAVGLVGMALGAARAVVLDADALTILSQHPELFAALHARCVLTPHSGEFARLFPDIAAKLDAAALSGPAYSKVDGTREAAARAGCVVLFKGADTVIAEPSGRCSINSAQYGRAAPWLATAGSGDVLAGFIAGLLARGFVPMQAAETAAWLHVECARSFGPGLIAEDLPEELPKVFRGLGL